jgi:hypothetical protein
MTSFANRAHDPQNGSPSCALGGVMQSQRSVGGVVQEFAQGLAWG